MTSVSRIIFCMLRVSVSPRCCFFEGKRFATHFSPDVSLGTDFLGRQMKPRRAIETVAVKQSHRRHAASRTDRHQILRQGRAFKEAESGAGVEFDIHRVIWPSGIWDRRIEEFFNQYMIFMAR